MSHLASEHPWVVLPTYNEVGNIIDLVDAVLSAVPSASILVVDDSSPDGTGDLVEKLGANDRRVRVLLRPEKEGLGAAYRAGFQEALVGGATSIVEIDADFSHDPTVIPRLLVALDDGAGLVVGSRYTKGGSADGLGTYRLLISRLGNLYAAFMLGLRVRDATSGFRAFKAEVLRAIPLDEVRADGYGFQVEMAYLVTKLGFRITEVPVVFHDRREGTSKMSSQIVVEAMMLCTVWGLARWLPWLRQGSRQDRLIDRLERVIR
ncbi:polyprenol monophosphomannose synthase [Ferrimicrobium sp.]|uniref:polyprenol monophosphomannose synthase n=1 Tax=Ferrimicrobium sp. TaxID=2926050 RepID=UPI00260672F7|nr:polyprenol monophosphomannose synthase [Ferrimicrobium sp.]